MGHLGVVLYEYLGEEYPEVLGSILGALKAIVNVIGMTKMTPPIKDLLPRLTPILKNRYIFSVPSELRLKKNTYFQNLCRANYERFLKSGLRGLAPACDSVAKMLNSYIDSGTVAKKKFIVLTIF